LGISSLKPVAACWEIRQELLNLFQAEASKPGKAQRLPTGNEYHISATLKTAHCLGELLHVSFGEQ